MKGLTDRQKQIADYMSSNTKIKTIANNLFITESCVKFHITRIYKKLGIKDRHGFYQAYQGGKNV